jgi:cyclase
MLRPRIIPSLLLHDGGLVKTVNFKSPKYVGDPINAVRIFNEKEVDELAFFDIDATVLKKEPNYKLIEKLANQSQMPLCYGGGVQKVEQVKRIFSLGVEKIALSNAVVRNPYLINEISSQVGVQSVIVVLDIRKKLLGGYEICTHNGKNATGINLFNFLRDIEKFGMGELIINSIDQDGTMKGYDMNLIDKVSQIITTPLTVLGGAGSILDIERVIDKHNIIGVAAGSLFLFKGPYKAVLINYPNRSEKDRIFKLNQIENTK